MIQGLTPAQLTADETLAKDPSIAGYQTLDDLMRSHRSAQKMVGNPDAFVKVPTESATEEERAAFFTRLGRPESPDGYKFKDPEGLPAGALPPADDFVKSFQGKAHEVGVSSDQAQKLYEWYRQNEAGELGRFTEQREADKREAEGALKQEWGAAFTTKLNAAEGVLNGLGDGLKTKLVQSGLQNDPDIIRMLAAVAEARGEDVDTRRGDSSGGMLTPAQAKAEAARLRGDEVFQKAWLDKTHPGHADAVTKMARLSELAYQDPSSG